MRLNTPAASVGYMLALMITLSSLIFAWQAAATPKKTKQIKIPQTASQITPTLYDLGTAKDIDGTKLQGYAFVYRKKAPTHKPNHPRKGGGDDTGSNCYAFLAPFGKSGVRWKVAEPYVIDPSNTSPTLDEVTVLLTIADSLKAWNDQTSSPVFGLETQGTVDPASVGNSVNGVNEVMFADIADAGVIAVTYVWGIFGGPPRGRELREWDMIFDEKDFTWGNAGTTNETALGDTSVMDLLNIAVHEAGHAAGLGHPADTCLQESMYRFATAGETKKRTLHAGDIAGIKALYK